MFVAILFRLSLLQLAVAKVQFLGVSIAGGDFGCTTDGSCTAGSTQLPLGSFGLGGGDGEGQMKHFVQDDMMNLFRLPISWQYLVNNQLGGSLNDANFAKYDRLVQACLATGAQCMVEIHNFARWNGKIIGQSPSGPTDDQFVALWASLAAKYAKADKIVFELMNEPHDLDIKIWAATCQKAVTAIRNAGALTQTVLLPGTGFSSAGDLVSSGSGDALMGIKNPDGSTENLLLAVHKYLDADNSGTHAECVTNNTAAFAEAANFLRKAGRKAIVSETGASPSNMLCYMHFCVQNAFINANSDVFVGLVSWGAGSFDSSYLMSQTPVFEGGRFVDNPLLAQCLVGIWMASDYLATVPTTFDGLGMTIVNGTAVTADAGAAATSTGNGVGSWSSKLSMPTWLLVVCMMMNLL